MITRINNIMVALAFALAFTFSVNIVMAEPMPRIRVASSYDYQTTLKMLAQAAKVNKLGIVTRASAQMGAKSIGVTIPGNQVWGLFAPLYAVRMLKASLESGIEAPVRLYITEDAKGAVVVSYIKPSDVFRPYGKKALNEMARELDGKFAKIVDTIR